jgi:hypothetical protein
MSVVHLSLTHSGHKMVGPGGSVVGQLLSLHRVSLNLNGFARAAAAKQTNMKTERTKISKLMNELDMI